MNSLLNVNLYFEQMQKISKLINKKIILNSSNIND